MPVLHIEHRIVDLNTWLQGLASRASVRKQAGVTGTRVLQAQDDPHRIIVHVTAKGDCTDYL